MIRKHIAFILFLFLGGTSLFAQYVKLLTWNIQDFGATKDETELEFMADVMKDYDIVAIQEVVTNPKGVQKLAHLADILNRKGSRWDYKYSDPTDSPPYKTERYAYLWKPKKAKLIGDPWLWKTAAGFIDREPFFARFEVDSRPLLLVNYHARRYDQQPEREIKYFRQLPDEYPNDILVFVGDFNVKPKHSVFNPLKKMGYRQVLKDHQKTTLKRKCKKGNYGSHSIDNILYPAQKTLFENGGVVDFVGGCENLTEARKISDHLPVFLTLLLYPD